MGVEEAGEGGASTAVELPVGGEPRETAVELGAGTGEGDLSVVAEDRRVADDVELPLVGAAEGSAAERGRQLGEVVDQKGGNG